MKFFMQVNIAKITQARVKRWRGKGERPKISCPRIDC
jgi:hypothetical protein